MKNAFYWAKPTSQSNGDLKGDIAREEGVKTVLTEDVSSTHGVFCGPVRACGLRELQSNGLTC